MVGTSAPPSSASAGELHFPQRRGRQAVADALKTAARNGVEVRLLYDAIGSQMTQRRSSRKLQRAGVQVALFHSLGAFFRRFSVLAPAEPPRTTANCWMIDDPPPTSAA